MIGINLESSLSVFLNCISPLKFKISKGNDTSQKTLEDFGERLNIITHIRRGDQQNDFKYATQTIHVAIFMSFEEKDK